MSRKSLPLLANSPLPPRPGEGKRGEKGYLGYLLRQAGVVHRTAMESTLADLGLTLPQFSVLTMIRAYPGLSNADLARLSLLTPQTVNVIVANLEKRKALCRQPHPVHGRIRQLTATESGSKLLDACRKRVEAVECWLAHDLSAADEKVVRHWLASLARHAER